VTTVCRTFSITLLGLAPCCLPLATKAATLNAASAAYQDVYNAVQAAQDGDTVIIPAGTASWTSTHTITKAIQIFSANINATDDLTVIQDNVAPVGVNNTVIIFKVTLTPAQRLGEGRLVTLSGSGASAQGKLTGPDLGIGGSGAASFSAIG
jgi:hypothetical protein